MRGLSLGLDALKSVGGASHLHVVPTPQPPLHALCAGPRYRKVMDWAFLPVSGFPGGGCSRTPPPPPPLPRVGPWVPGVLYVGCSHGPGIFTVPPPRVTCDRWTGQQPRADLKAGSGARKVFRVFHPNLNSPQNSEQIEYRHRTEQCFAQTYHQSSQTQCNSKLHQCSPQSSPNKIHCSKYNTGVQTWSSSSTTLSAKDERVFFPPSAGQKSAVTLGGGGGGGCRAG